MRIVFFLFIRLRGYVFLFQEIIALRKEKEQDKQTIKLLQEQMVCLSLSFNRNQYLRNWILF